MMVSRHYKHGDSLQLVYVVYKVMFCKEEI